MRCFDDAVPFKLTVTVGNAGPESYILFYGNFLALFLLFLFGTFVGATFLPSLLLAFFYTTAFTGRGFPLTATGF
jgi:hypothetical protein